MTRVALLAGWYYPDSVGGTEEYVCALATELAKFRHEVSILAPSADERPHEYEYEGIRVYRYPVAVQPSREELHSLTEPRYIHEFTGWIERHRPEIVHTHSLTRGCGSAHLTRVADLGIPYVVTVHTPNVVCERGTLMRWGTEPCDGRFRPVLCSSCCMQELGMPRLAAWPLATASVANSPRVLPNVVRTVVEYRAHLVARRAATAEILSRAARVIAVSQWLYDLLVEHGIDKHRLRLSRQGLTRIEPAVPRIHRQADAPLRIAYLGRFDRVKGVDVLIRAFRRLPPSREVELHLFGVAQGSEGVSYMAALHRIAGRDSRILFHGPVNSDDRQRVLQEMDLLAVPSVWFETGPLVVLEAFAAGLPVVGSDLGGIAERVRHGESGWLVPAGDIGAWTRALALLHDRWLAAHWVWRFPQPRMASQVATEMQAIYEELLHSPDPAP